MDIRDYTSSVELMSTEKKIEPLPTPHKVKTLLPADHQLDTFVSRSRQTLRDILNGANKRKVVILGPCSIHDLAAAEEYAERVKKLSDDVSDVLFLVMRAYYEKPRTLLGWKGLCLDPHLDGSYDVAHGIQATRELLLSINRLDVPAACEFLTPLTAPYFEDLITWGCIGSRTAESQTHRELASGLPMPIAFKNNTNGNVDIAIKGVLASASAHRYLTIDEHGQACTHLSCGNEECHVVLRGGESGPNYSNEVITSTLEALEQANLPLRLLIDCSHDNSGRDYERQPMVFEEVLDQILAGNEAIKGFIVESHLYAGKQKMNGNLLDYGVSVTDSCLDWEATEALIRQAASALRNQYPTSPKEGATPQGEAYAEELVTY